MIGAVHPACDGPVMVGAGFQLVDQSFSDLTG